MNRSKQIINLYVDGFKNLTLGKTLWKIIILKLLIIFTFLNYYIYDKSIKSEYQTETEKIDFVYKNITKE
ncbi:DUF4492 domain-containing protein [Halarcobacter anaerophilus]|jgi:hypothetical protein|uniref:DUF4492 domain-containing protein n=1 Tax=Halarcobacter anaerophilus TaxID=877500 RepID=A0A4Q0XY79_9BACT|nr:DUF4492 domain-containing protein [Halarcobacter anaerophilus]QDF28842.1 DUF4492 domain-containing protein [Halarcobacter anaerophilus]RXJ61249.1 DUF4492 domain-containing protein [Halarcobacter anaerophilus]